MNNDLNNNSSNLGGNVLGSVNNTPNNNMPNSNINNNVLSTNEETLESLDLGNQNNQVINNGLNSNIVNNNPSNLVNNGVVMNNPVNDQTLNPSPLNSQNLNDNLNNPGINPNSNPSTVMAPPPSNPVTPEPAYTNPQNINPMPGFEPNSIGVTPPISLEPEKEPKKKKNNKTIFVIVIILVLFGIGFGTYYVLKYTDILNNKPKIEITTRNLEINLGDTLSTNINDYATITNTDVTNCTIDTTGVNVNTPGTYTYTISCGEIRESGSVVVVDNTELEVNTKKVYKVVGESVNPTDFIEEVNTTYSYEFVNSEEVNNYLNGSAGTYKVKIKVSAGEKTREVEADLVVILSEIKGYLVCSSKEQVVENNSASMVVREKFGIIDTDTAKNVYGNIYSQEYIFKFSDETEYTNYLAEYNAYNSITINNITGSASFDNDDLEITITREKTDSELETEYGITNSTTWSDIRNHFTGTLGYDCSYRKAE